MKKLFAIFDVDLPETLILKGDQSPFEYCGEQAAFSWELSLGADQGTRRKAKDHRHWTYGCTRVTLTVGREETVTPPKRGTDAKATYQYFAKRLEDYLPVALGILKNLVEFAKYRLQQPVSPFVETTALKNPRWVDEAGIDVGRGTVHITLDGPTGLMGRFGCKPLTRSQNSAVQSAIQSPRAVKLHEELLSDAQAAAYSENFRRAVLELAIACEVFIKTTFFDPDDRSGLVYEALENQRKINVRVLDLLETGSTVVFGRSFRQYDQKAFNDIDDIFRARNKVAHRGEAAFRRDNGTRVVVDQKLLEQWWTSVDKLFRWSP